MCNFVLILQFTGKLATTRKKKTCICRWHIQVEILSLNLINWISKDSKDDSHPFEASKTPINIRVRKKRGKTEYFTITVSFYACNDRYRWEDHGRYKDNVLSSMFQLEINIKSCKRRGPTRYFCSSSREVIMLKEID